MKLIPVSSFPGSSLSCYSLGVCVCVGRGGGGGGGERTLGKDFSCNFSNCNMIKMAKI